MPAVRTMGQILSCAILGLFLQQSGDPANKLVQAFVDAYNRQDIAYFEKTLAPDVVVPDDDGHILVDRPHMIDLFRRRFMPKPPDKLTPSNIVTRASGDVIWASFAYTFDQSGGQTKGLISMVFKKAGNDWQIALIHYSINLTPRRPQG